MTSRGKDRHYRRRRERRPAAAAAAVSTSFSLLFLLILVFSCCCCSGIVVSAAFLGAGAGKNRRFGRGRGAGAAETSSPPSTTRHSRPSWTAAAAAAVRGGGGGGDACSPSSSKATALSGAAAGTNNGEGGDDYLPPHRWACPESLSCICGGTGTGGGGTGEHSSPSSSNSNSITLSRYMREMARANPELEQIESIFTSLQTATKTISNLVRRSTLSGNLGYEESNTINVQGEQQKKLDVLTNDVLKASLEWSGHLATLASEEEDVPVMVTDTRGNSVYSSDILIDEVSGGRYVAVFDPLDGSSNVDANIPTGTIFGIFESDQECLLLDMDDDGILDSEEQRCLQSTLQPGRNLVAAGYCLYSSSTVLVFTIGNGVQGFTLDEGIGEYRLTHPDIRIPDRGSIYSFNEANRWDWDEPLREYISAIQQGRGQARERYSSRYIGSMVGDVHRTLLYGGIFGYPADKKNPNGKLRLLYEAAPMSFLVEQAGGMALTGKSRIMELVPQNVHQRVPCILGSRGDVRELQSYYEASDDPDLIARCEARATSAGGGATSASATKKQEKEEEEIPFE